MGSLEIKAHNYNKQYPFLNVRITTGERTNISIKEKRKFEFTNRNIRRTFVCSEQQDAVRFNYMQLLDSNRFVEH